jgi:acyl-coenzyme A synthetase/AMP-(fatty) acid ligase
MPQSDLSSLWDALTAARQFSDQSIRCAPSCVLLSDLLHKSSLSVPLEQLSNSTVLIATKGQFATALALIELDGIARRIVLYPGDLPRAHIPSVVASANIDAIVLDSDAPEPCSYGLKCVVTSSPALSIVEHSRGSARPSEWVLLTSGTTGLPKLTLHTLSTLAGAITSDGERDASVHWSTFYDIRRYGGLQIFLRALLHGASLTLGKSEESMGDFLTRAGAEGVTHISGTPSHWRCALMSPLVHQIAPKYIRISGEIVDQGILDNLRSAFKNATIVHAFASTEAGVGFEVSDGLAGFPTRTLENSSAGVEMKIENGSLRIRSSRVAVRYLGSEPLVNSDGFVDTGDLVELHGDRYYFVGRRDGVINVGGAKVHPEEIEAVLNRHPRIQMSRAKARRNPITGAIVVADIVLNSSNDNNAIETATLKTELIEMCRRVLSPYKVPAAIRIVPSLDVSASGKLVRVGA